MALQVYEHKRKGVKEKHSSSSCDTFTSCNLCSSLSYQVCFCEVKSHEGASDRNGGLPGHSPQCSSGGFQTAKCSEASPRMTGLHSNLSTRPPVSQRYLFQLMPKGRLLEIVCALSVASVMFHFLLFVVYGVQSDQISMSMDYLFKVK